MNKKGQTIIPVMINGNGTLGLVGILISVLIWLIYILIKDSGFMPFKFIFPIMLITTGIGTYLDYKIFKRNKKNKILIIILDIFALIVMGIIFYYIPKI